MEINFKVVVKDTGVEFIDGKAYEVSVSAGGIFTKFEVLANSEKEAIKEAFPVFFKFEEEAHEAIKKHFQKA